MGVLPNTKFFGAALGAFATACVIGASLATVASAGGSGVGLGTAKPFAVLAGAGVTNTGSSVINGDLGTCPTPAITGFPPGVVNGTIHADDAVACGAKSDATTAYNDAAGRAPTRTYGGTTDLGGATVVGGVYKTPTSFAITGTLTLDGQNDPNSTFIFQAGSTVITETNSSVSLINGAQACNVFWQVGSSGTLGVGSHFVGTMLALTSITADTNAIVAGRLLARNGAVTLDSNHVSRPACAAPTTTTSTSVATTTSAPGATTSTSTATTTSSTTPITPTTRSATTTSTPPPNTTTTMRPSTTTTSASPMTTTTVATNGGTTPTTWQSTTTVQARLQPTPTTAPVASASAAGTAVPGGQLAGGHAAAATTGGDTNALARTGGVSLWQPLLGFALLGIGMVMRRAAA